MIRNIIWDVDGTLFDTYPAMDRAVQNALRDLGKDAALERISALTRVSLGECLSTLAEEFQLSAEEIGERFDGYYARTTLLEQPPFPGVTAVCAYICSLGGKNSIVTHRGRASTTELLAAHGMSAYFSGCAARDDGYPRKPDPAAFLAVLQAHGLKPEETITVGDRDIDMLAGKAAGVLTCLFGPGNEGVGADIVFKDFDELMAFIRSENGKQLQGG
jgi:phosphoglycolate phosphatase-like HAD superfamily hydrolase